MALQDILSPFVWGQGGAQLTPDQIAQRQALAKGLLGTATDTSPTAGGWASVLTKALAGGMAGYDMRRADAATTQNAEASQSLVAKMLSGLTGGAPATTNGAPAVGATTHADAMIPMTGSANEIAATSPGVSAPDNIKGLIASNVPADLQPYVTNLIGKESGFDPNAVSPTGATGLAQFTRGTGKQYGLISDEGDLRKDPVANLNALVALTNDNRAGLTQALGRPPTDGELALAHQQGLQGAVNLLSGKAVPAQNLAVNNIDPNSDPRSAANKIMSFYGGTGGAAPAPQVAQALAPALPKTSSINPAVIEGLSNPYILDQARSVAGALLQQDFQRQQMTAKAQQAQQQAAYEAWLKQQDPAYQAQLAMTKAQTDQIVNPRMSPAEQANTDLSNRKFAYEQKKDSTISPLDQANLSLSRDKFNFDQQNAANTNDIRDFNFAKQNGYTGNFADYQIALKQAGRPSTVINNGPNSNKFVEKSDEAAAKRFDDIVTSGQTAPQTMADMQQLLDLGAKIGTGAGAQVKGALGPYANALGINIDGLDDIQAYQAITSRLAPQMRAVGSGSSSDRDVALFFQSLPNVRNTPGGNEMIANTTKSVAQNKINAAAIARQAQSGRITWQEADDQISKLPDPYELFKQFQSKSNQGANRTSSGVQWSIEK